MNKVILKRGRDSSVKRYHPWVFSGAIAELKGTPKEGEVIELYSSDRELLGYGHYQEGSIAVRLLTFGKEPISTTFWQQRLKQAYDLRVASGILNNSNCYRLVHGEGDSLPGLIIDFYNGIAVIQAHSAGIFLSLKDIAEALKVLYGDSLKGVYDKSSGTAPFKAGLELCDGYISGGNAIGENGQDINGVTVSENGHLFCVDWEKGQKTGFFLDQRDNRALLKSYSAGKRVLNLFSYTGGFSIYSLAGGALTVDSVDSSKRAVELMDMNVIINREHFIISRDVIHRSHCADVISFMKECAKGEYDLVVVDPPAFAKHRGALSNALRAYQRLNASVIEKVASGGIIFTFSCSQVVEKSMFAEAVFSAAAQTGRSVRIIGRMTQPTDHPVNIYHPEGEYLKGLVLYVE
jgi:Predicted SAM-dependent methyltransferases